MSQNTEQQFQQPNREGDKAKIIMIYAAVAIICAILIAGFMFIGSRSRTKMTSHADKGSAKVVDVQFLSMEESVGLHDIMKLEEDFTATNQDGEEVTLQSLKGKVWVFAQFYGSCPECNKVNLDILTDLYKKYESNPNFQIVTVSIMAEDDGVKSMKNMAETRDAKTSNWWFLTADVEAVNKFCSENMLYAKFEKNTNKEESGMQGEISHDMGMAVFNADMTMKAKVDVYAEMTKKNTLGVELKKNQLDLEVAAALKAL